MAAEKITSASDLKTEKITPWTWQAALETSQKRQEKEWVWDIHKAGEESELSYSSQHSISNGIFHYDPALQGRQRWDNRKESLGQPLSAGGRDCSRKDSRRKMQAVI